MTIENQLKANILNQYKSIRAFTMAIDVPYSTIDTMLKKGIGGAGVNTVLKVCVALGIDVEGLLRGEITKKALTSVAFDYSQHERDLICAYRQASDDDLAVVDAALRKYMTCQTMGDAKEMA